MFEKAKEKVREKVQEIGQDFSAVAESLHSVAVVAIVALITAVSAFCIALFAVRQNYVAAE